MKWQSVLFTNKGTEILEGLGKDERTGFPEWELHVDKVPEQWAGFWEWELHMDRVPEQWDTGVFPTEQLAPAWLQGFLTMSWGKWGNVGF